MPLDPAFISRYADDIAFVAEEQPATNAEDFISQLQHAGYVLDTYAGITGAEDLDTAATYLSDALDSTGDEHRLLVDRAAKYLAGASDMVEEYRLMV
ncbi:hypothetical protein [Streptomyces sp. NBC_01506]|uniref:hypothetical protein n=1 Tax=Streptomyces sp. NBC_01506 TaxID=2903887 RepID=UPI002F9178C4